jgi:hypothetical protein
MKDGPHGHLVTRQVSVFAPLSTGRWVVTLTDERGFSRPWPHADRSLIGRGGSFIDGECGRQRADLLELRTDDGVPVIYVATDPGHPATLARTKAPADPSPMCWSDQTGAWILECLRDLLGLGLEP